MYRFFKTTMLVLIGFMVVASGTSGLKTIVLKPLVTVGTDVSFIMVPGAYVSGEQYTELGTALQKASPHKLWVGLTTDYIGNLVNPAQLGVAINDATQDLIKAGMPASAKVFLAAHSLGGVFLDMFVPSHVANTAGMILYGSYFKKGELATFPVPTLTLSGDLDGLVRITRIAVQFKELMNYIANDNKDGAMRFPTVTLMGVNHGQYFTGNIPRNVQKYDITSEVDGPTGRQMIAEATVDFMIKTLGMPQSRLADATNNLAKYYQENEKRMQPILDVFALEKEGGSSNFSKKAQRVTSGLQINKWDRLLVFNDVHSGIQFVMDKPALKIVGNQAVLATYSDVAKPENPMDVSTINESATNIAIKMKTSNAIQKELNDGLKFNTSVTCQDVNKMSYELAHIMSSSLAIKRFSAMNYTFNFAEDDLVGSGPEFLIGKLQFSKKGKSILIRSTALKTSLDVPIKSIAGQHYCQAISPARLLEFIYVDGLRLHD